MTSRIFSASRFSALLLLTSLSLPTEGLADPASRVLIVAASNPSALLEEGLVRVQGELAAMGLSTQVRLEGSADSVVQPRPPSDFQGALVFERFGDWLRIQAWNPAAAMPVTQWIDASDPAVDAEVLAVRAVEALRAALLPYSRFRGESRAAPVSQPPHESPERALHDTGAADQGSSVEETDVRQHLWAGPAVGVHLGASTVQYGINGGYTCRFEALSAGLRLEATRADVPVKEQAGEVHVVRLGAVLEGRVWTALRTDWDAFAGIGIGVLHHRIQGIAREGYSGETGTHTTAAGSVDAGTTYSFDSNLGAYVSTRVAVATDAPVIRVDRRPIATLARPELTLSAGLLVALD